MKLLVSKPISGISASWPILHLIQCYHAGSPSSWARPPAWCPPRRPRSPRTCAASQASPPSGCRLQLAAFFNHFFCKFLFVLRFGATSFKSQALAQSFTWQVPKEFVVPQWGRTDGRRGKVEGERARVKEEGKCKWSRYGRDGAAPWLHSSSHTSLLLVHLRLQLPHPTPPPPPPPPMPPPCLAAQLSCRCSRAKTFETSFIRARNFLCGLAIFSSNWIKMVKIRLAQYEAIREIPF